MSDNDWCPLIQKKCKQHKCKFYMQVRGTNPQTGAEVDKWDCAVALLPMLTIENSQQQRQTAAAVESFRNEMVKANNNSVKLLANAAKLHLVSDKS